MNLIFKTYSLIVSLITVIIISVSCSKNSSLDFIKTTIDVELLNEIRFVIGDSPTTKADITSLDQMYVRCVKGQPGRIAETAVWQSIFTCESSSSTNQFTGNKYWPSTDLKYNFYASNISMNASSSGTYLNVNTGTDVVVGFIEYLPEHYNNGIVPIQLNHIFSKIGYCKVTSPSGYTVSDLSVSILPYTNGKFYPYDRTWSDLTLASSPSIIANNLNSGTSKELYIIPGSYILTLSYTLTNTNNGKVESETKYVELPFESGVKTNIILNIPPSNEPTSGGIIIGGWVDGGDIGETM